MKAYRDGYRHRGLRAKLVNDLRRKGINDHRVLQAIGQIPRHYFLDDAFTDWAYQDVAFPIGADQTISQPFTVALQTELLQLTTTDKVLEIGTGSGYQACVLHHIARRVYSIERQESLFYLTEKRLRQIGYDRIRTRLGDGFAGMPRFAPFDKILITCGASHVPSALVDQLKEGGIMVIPVGQDTQQMIRITKSKGRIKKENFGKCAFVPMLQGLAS